MQTTAPASFPAEPENAAQNEPWHEQYAQLVEKYREPGESDFAVCKRLAPILSKVARLHSPWSASYLLHVLHRSPKVGPSPVFQIAVGKLFNKKARIRKDRPRLYIPFENKREIEFVEACLSTEERRRALLLAATKRGRGIAAVGDAIRQGLGE